MNFGKAWGGIALCCVDSASLEGTWQVSSNDLMQTGLASLLGATVIEGSVGVPSCVTANGQTFIDFFVVSDGIAAGTQDCCTDLSAVIPTHRPVGFSLQCDIGGLTSTAPPSPLDPFDVSPKGSVRLAEGWRGGSSAHGVPGAGLRCAALGPVPSVVGADDHARPGTVCSIPPGAAAPAPPELGFRRPQHYPSTTLVLP